VGLILELEVLGILLFNYVEAKKPTDPEPDLCFRPRLEEVLLDPPVVVGSVL
jgi:hypothetical protein